MPISIKLGIKQPWLNVNQNYSNTRPGPVQMEGDYRNAKIWWGHLKSFFSRTTEPEKLRFT
jgi:hypothetical protein